MKKDGADEFNQLRVDGGMVVNDWVVQRLADVLNVEVHRPRVIETTALGVAYLAGLQQGVFDSLSAIAGRWEHDATFHAKWNDEQRQRGYDGWLDAVGRIRH